MIGFINFIIIGRIYHLYIIILCPEWPHRQCVGLAFRRSHVRGSLSAVSLVICSPARIAVCNTWSSGGTALFRVGGATSQLDLPSLTPLYIAGCDWLQLGAPHWASSVNYCKLIIEPTFCGSRFFTDRLLAITDFAFTLLYWSDLSVLSLLVGFISFIIIGWIYQFYHYWSDLTVFFIIKKTVCVFYASNFVSC